MPSVAPPVRQFMLDVIMNFGKATHLTLTSWFSVIYIKRSGTEHDFGTWSFNIYGHNHGKEKNETQYKSDLCLTLGENIEK